MTAPGSTSAPSRWNVGPYVVQVELRTQTRPPRYVPGFGVFSRRLIPALYLTRIQNASVSAEGALNVEPEAWQTRHYWRAVMRGAGVYQAGLWARLAQRRVKVKINGARPLYNFITETALTILDKEVLFNRWGYVEPPSIEEINSKNYRRKFRRIWGHTKKTQDKRSNSFNRSPAYRLYESYFKLLENMGLDNKMYSLYIQWESQWISESQKARLHCLADRGLTLEFLGSRTGIESLRTLLLTIVKRGDLYRSYLARLLRPRRLPSRAPRPLHTRPRPPSAPLAPPVL